MWVITVVSNSYRQIRSLFLGGFCLLMVTGCATVNGENGVLEPAPVTAQAELPGTEDVRKGQAHFTAGRYGLSEHSFRAAVENNPRDIDAWIGLAASYDRLRRFDLAGRAYKNALKLDRNNPAVLNNLGYSYLLRGNITKARKTFAQARTLDPNNPNIQANLALLEKGAAL